MVDPFLKEMLQRHEGRKQFVYRCPAGKLTIGVGHNLDDNGLPNEIIDALLEYDIRIAEADCIRLLGPQVWLKFSPRRQAALIDWMFNLGYTRAAGFKDTLRYLRLQNYTEAARCLGESLWAKQVGQRAMEIIKIIDSG